jgi:hypothetical protein
MGGIELICIERRGVCGVLNLGKFSSERRSQAYGLISFNADAFPSDVTGRTKVAQLSMDVGQGGAGQATFSR